MIKRPEILTEESIERNLSEDQIWKYVEEFAVLYRNEKDRRLQLEKANRELGQLRERLEMKNDYLWEEVQTEKSCKGIIGNSLALQGVLSQITMVARTDANVLIEGETGTGKELIARAIHDQSKRSPRPLIKVNCGSIPRDLFESEFFGHIKGAFTGAVKDRTGRFQLADRGTLFLDEIGEVPLDLQSKLLRVLQEGQFERVGEDRTREVNVRIIAATNRDLNQEVREGRFREDLFYRLSVVPIHVPPLRERQGDLEILARHFVKTISNQIGVSGLTLSSENIRQLEAYSWPGNIRELQNVIERYIIVSNDFSDENIERYLNTSLHLPSHSIKTHTGSLQGEALAPCPFPMDKEAKNSLEKQQILMTLQKTNWKVYGPRGAAEVLRLKPTTLAYRMKKFNIQKPYPTVS